MQLQDLFSKRYETIYFLSSGLLIAFCLRICMSVACVKMAEELDWDESQKGYILSAFYWGYAPGQMFASYGTSRIGAKWVYGMSILIPSIMSIALPSVILHSYEAGLFVRGFLGLCASGTFPALFYFYPEWIPLEEKTILLALVSSGVCIGEMISFSVSGYLAENRLMWGDLNVGGWASSFVWFGIVGVLWYPLFISFVYSSPLDHPTISKAELAIIYRGKEGYEYLCEGVQDEEAESTKPLLSGASYDATKAEAGNSPYEAYTSSSPLPTPPTHADAASKHHQHTSSRTVSRQYSVDVSADALPVSLRGQSSSMEIVFDPRANAMHETTTVDSRGRVKISLVKFSEVPWGKFFRHPAALTLLFNSWILGWFGLMLLSEIPAYLTDQLGFDLSSAGAFSILPYFANFVSSLLFGALFDHLQNRRDDSGTCGGWFFSGKPYTVREIRQLSQFIGFGAASLVLLATSFITDQSLAFAMMVLSLFVFGGSVGGVACGYLDIAPRYSSVYNAVGNTIAAGAGFVSPIFVSACLSSLPGRVAWRVVFGSTVVMCWAALLSWHFFQTSTIIPELNTPVVSDESMSSADKLDSDKDATAMADERKRVIEGILNDN